MSFHWVNWRHTDWPFLFLILVAILYLHFVMLETIDLSIFPKPYYHSPGTVLTLGDLHANPILFIYFLQKNGVISISRQTYLKLYKLYQQIGQQQEFDPNSWNLELQKQYSSFLKLLDELVINPCRIKIRLLGDELADRGECDLFIMLILSQLHDHGVHFSILVSNHGVTFLSSLQYILEEQKLDHHSRILSDENMRSFLALQKVVFYQVISNNWIKKWLENVYLPHLELLDYGYSYDSRFFYIFTHAAMGFKQLRALTAEYQIDWQDNDMDALANTLKNLKNMFRYQKKEELITLFRNNARDPDAKLIQKHLIETVFWRDLIWNRKYESIRPFKHHAYLVFNVHGHDQGFKKNHDYFLSLDSALGKYYYNIQGQMKTLVIQERKYSHKKTATKVLSGFSIFKPYISGLPSLNQSLLILGIGVLIKYQCSIMLLSPFIDYIKEQFLFYSKFKLVKN